MMTGLKDSKSLKKKQITKKKKKKKKGWTFPNESGEIK